MEGNVRDYSLGGFPSQRPSGNLPVLLMIAGLTQILHYYYYYHALCKYLTVNMWMTKKVNICAHFACKHKYNVCHLP